MTEHRPSRRSRADAPRSTPAIDNSLLIGPRSRKLWHRPLQRSCDPSCRAPVAATSFALGAAAWSRAPAGLQEHLADDLKKAPLAAVTGRSEPLCVQFSALIGEVRFAVKWTENRAPARGGPCEGAVQRSSSVGYLAGSAGDPDPDPGPSLARPAQRSRLDFAVVCVKFSNLIMVRDAIPVLNLLRQSRP